MGDREGARPVSILLVEDNPGDVRLIQEAFDGARIANELRVVGRVGEVADYLHRRGDHADAERPDVVLTCLYLPDGSAADVIEAVEDAGELTDVPVVVVSGAPAPEDALGEVEADAYLRKPIHGDEFIEVSRTVCSFWVQLVDSPPGDG